MSDELNAPVEPRRSRKPLIAAVCVLTVLGLCAASGADHVRAADADDTLKSVQDATADASSFRFKVKETVKAAVGGSDAGADSTSRVTGEGAWTEDAWQASVDMGLASAESVYNGSDIYERWAATADDLKNEKWSLWEEPGLTTQEGLAVISQAAQDLARSGDDVGADGAADVLDMASVSLAQAIFMGGGGEQAATDAGGLVHNPAAFLDSLQDLSEPDESDDTLTATFEAPAGIVEAFGNTIPAAKVEMDLDDDLPTSLKVSTKQGDTSAELTFELTDWNSDISIDVPDGSDLDDTPWVDEEGLTAATDIAFVWPTAPPAGWEFSVWSPQELADAGDDSVCELVELAWDEPLPVDATDDQVDQSGYLSLYLRSADCARQQDPDEFEPGGPGGLPVRRDEFDLREVLVGDTAVEVDTSLSDDDLNTVIASLTPVDVQAIIAAAVAPPPDSPPPNALDPMTTPTSTAPATTAGV